MRSSVSMMNGMFNDRIDAGEKLVQKLVKHAKNSTIVVALPRGGVVVGYPIAKALHVPMEVVVVRKLGSPHNPELGIGAIAEEGIIYLDTDMIDMLQISSQMLHYIRDVEAVELDRRVRLYRHGESLPLLTNKTVILVDDGLATGVSARAAILSLKKHHPKKLVFAVPVCSRQTAEELQSWVDAIICLESPEKLQAIGEFYHDFKQVSDEEVQDLLHKVNAVDPLKITGENGFEHKIVW